VGRRRCRGRHLPQVVPMTSSREGARVRGRSGERTGRPRRRSRKAAGDGPRRAALDFPRDLLISPHTDRPDEPQVRSRHASMPPVRLGARQVGATSPAPPPRRRRSALVGPRLAWSACDTFLKPLTCAAAASNSSFAVMPAAAVAERGSDGRRARGVTSWVAHRRGRARRGRHLSSAVRQRLGSRPTLPSPTARASRVAGIWRQTRPHTRRRTPTRPNARRPVARRRRRRRSPSRASNRHAPASPDVSPHTATRQLGRTGPARVATDATVALGAGSWGDRLPRPRRPLSLVDHSRSNLATPAP